ncbi:ATP-dependent RecD-like DNA helicase [Mangrovimonas sp. TPBH4]|uniref:ATP-dependent DNA helicase n=1 Tax=Mangrovimonas sp. TPBH4 TaxID=1645914 RepID=UPI0006B464FB|nr:AAA family ATPase [Mangrovimonas sp. TPBH4]
MESVQLNIQQQQIFDKILAFLESETHNTFILGGYAGTGKTFLMQHLANRLNQNQKTFHLLASTGRAASVLKGKTNFETQTVHSFIYHFDEITGIDEDPQEMDQYGQLTLSFGLKQNKSQGNAVIIIDEASMISSEKQDETSFAQFGSGHLLDDLFLFTKTDKVIFVGDPAQLPPVKQHFSPALDATYLNSIGRKVLQGTLMKIERTQHGNDILKTAQHIRELLEASNLPKWIKIPCRFKKNITVFPQENILLATYISQYKLLGPQHTILICNSNNLVAQCNQNVRNVLYGQKASTLQIGEILLVTQNNYLVPLTNGDFVEVKQIGNIVYKANLKFMSVRVAPLGSKRCFEIYLAMDILDSYVNNFTAEQHKNLMIDFVQRMKQNNVKPKSPEFVEALQKDAYLNCLKATYGYAVTCHKSQGGEWDYVYIYGKNAMLPVPKHVDKLHWWYTALTRAKQQVFTNNGYWIS